MNPAEIHSEVQLQMELDKVLAEVNAMPQEDFRNRAIKLAQTHSDLVEIFDNPASSGDLKLYVVKCVLVVSEVTNILHESIAKAMLGRYPSAMQKQILEETKAIVLHQLNKQGGINGTT